MSSLLEGSVKRHLFRLTLPSIGGMFAIMALNLTDTFFVSRLGTDELAAMGFTFAVVMMVGALAIGFSSGATSIVTRALGAGNLSLARRTVADGLCLTLLGTLFVSWGGYFSITPLFGLLGANGHVLELVREYMRVWYLGAVFCVVPPVSDSCLRATGDMVRPLLVMCTAALLNLILDPILIFGVEPLGIPAMGMAGAAYATIFARIVAGLLTLGFLHFHARLIDWGRPHLRELFHSWREILRLGIPAAVNQVLLPVSQAIFTRLAAMAGGVPAVAAIATGSRIENLLLLVAMAYGIAVVPLVGQNYGAQAMDRVRETRSISTRFAYFYSATCLVVLVFCAAPLARLFSKDEVVIHFAVLYLMGAALGQSGLNLTNWTSLMINTAGYPREVMLLNLGRVFVFLIPLCIFGTRLFGFIGLVGGITLGNLISGYLAWRLGRRRLN